jgi:hypothetical protein
MKNSFVNVFGCKNVCRLWVFDVRLHANCETLHDSISGGKDTSKHIALIKLIYSRMELIIETLPQGGKRKTIALIPQSQTAKNRIIPFKIGNNKQNPYAVKICCVFLKLKCLFFVSFIPLFFPLILNAARSVWWQYFLVVLKEANSSFEP